MTNTVVSSARREVTIDFDRPFVIIGERINPTGRKKLSEEIKNGDFSRVEADADVVVDPLVMPIGAVETAGKQAMELIRRLRNELKVNTTCGASNVSFGLPNRMGLNTAFLNMAIASGLTSAIMNPLHGELIQAVRGSDVMMGNDTRCSAWIQNYRDPEADNLNRRPRKRRRSAWQSRELA